MAKNGLVNGDQNLVITNKINPHGVSNSSDKCFAVDYHTNKRLQSVNFACITKMGVSLNVFPNHIYKWESHENVVHFRAHHMRL